MLFAAIATAVSMAAHFGIWSWLFAGEPGNGVAYWAGALTFYTFLAIHKARQ